MQKSIFKEFNIYLIFGITLFAVMGVASITPAFPVIIKYFGLSVKQIGYLISFFTLPGILLAPFMGILADRYGRKTILIPSMLLFGIAGLLCAFQDNFHNLLILRFFQGMGAASLGSLNVTIIGDLFSDKKRIQVMGYNASVLSLGTASFPAIGGFIASMHWQYVFFLPALILPFAFLVLFKLKTPKLQANISLKNYLGNVWKTVNRKQVWGLFIVNILIFVILYGAYLSFFPILLDHRFHASTSTIGMLMSLMSLTTAICSSQLSKARAIFSVQKLLTISAVFYALSLILLGFSFNWFVLILAVIIFGMGHGFLIPNIQTALVGLAPLTERAAFMSLNGMVLRVGQTIGPILVAFFYIQQNLAWVFFISAVIPLLMIIIIKTMVGKLE
ncbi:MAG: MFS transporter [Salinivirgaceae bacterium]|nr:MFS transporter [Salinivirgaceae bacterium]